MSGKTKKTSERKFKVGQVVFRCFQSFDTFDLSMVRITKVRTSKNNEDKKTFYNGQWKIRNVNCTTEWTSKRVNLDLSGYYDSPLKAVNAAVEEFVSKRNEEIKSSKEHPTLTDAILNYVFRDDPFPFFKVTALKEAINTLKKFHDIYTVALEIDYENASEKAHCL